MSYEAEEEDGLNMVYQAKVIVIQRVLDIKSLKKYMCVYTSVKYNASDIKAMLPFKAIHSHYLKLSKLI